jgi:hypothetical protein
MKRKYPHKGLIYHGKTYIVVGWREWVALPELGIDTIKAKIDTGARTSSLHAFNIERFKKAGRDMVSFMIHPIQRDDSKAVKCCAELVDIRYVTDSGAHRELRCVIETTLQLGGICLPIEITLTNRAKMTYRMLLGRKALKKIFIIDPSRSFHT